MWGTRGTGVALAVVAVVAVACSGGGAGAAPPSSAPPPPTPAPTSVVAAPPSATSVVAAPPSTTPEPAPVPSNAGAGGDCATTHLAGSLGPPEGTAGSTYRALLLTNTGPGTCALRGFPGVSYVAGEDGHQVGPAAVFDGARGGPVEIAAGRSATARLRLVDVGVFDPATCHPTAVRGLRVYPPGSTTALYVPMPGRGCAGDPGRPQLTVSTVERP